MIRIEIQEEDDSSFPLVKIPDRLEGFEQYKKTDLSFSGFKVEIIQSRSLRADTIITFGLKPGYKLVGDDD